MSSSSSVSYQYNANAMKESDKSKKCSQQITAAAINIMTYWHTNILVKMILFSAKCVDRNYHA